MFASTSSVNFWKNAFNSLSRDHLKTALRTPSVRPIPLSFQLPLSGSPSAREAFIDWLLKSVLSTPSLGITLPLDAKGITGPITILSTPSLGITNWEAGDRERHS